MWRWLLRAVEFLSEYWVLLYWWIAIGAWEDSAKHRVSPEIVWSTFVVLFVMASFRNWQKATASAEVAEPAAKREKPARTFAKEPEVLIAHLSDPKLLTRMQVVTYIEKWIVITGTVEWAGVTDLVIALQRGGRVSVHFSSENQLTDVRNGQVLTAVCQIKPSFVQPWVSLETAELVRVPASRPVLARAS
jgi:hypothetical protein